MSILTARALALFLGGFTALNLLGDWIAPGFDANVWWIDLRGLPESLQQVALGAGALGLLAFALRPRAGNPRRWFSAAIMILLLGAALTNAIGCLALHRDGVIRLGIPLPFSLFVAAALATVLAQMLRGGAEASTTRTTLLGLALSAALVVVFPLAQMACFGRTRYLRTADAIVVFGARAYASGRPSDALADRVRTACALYHEGLAGRLLFSGGPGDGEVHEVEAMRRMAISLGVPSEAILVDREGLNTAASVANTQRLAAALGLRRFVAVSHFYHLPRIKMAFQRVGLEVYTVPAQEQYILSRYPWLIGREVAAFWSYYLSPLRGQT